MSPAIARNWKCTGHVASHTGVTRRDPHSQLPEEGLEELTALLYSFLKSSEHGKCAFPSDDLFVLAGHRHLVRK
eukprot:gene15947-biopygen8210